MSTIAHDRQQQPQCVARFLDERSRFLAEILSEVLWWQKEAPATMELLRALPSDVHLELVQALLS